jgi:lipopolysaccharide transport system ATP-binding protein
MSQRVIEVRDVSKQYRLGKVGTGTFSEDVQRWWARMRGKPDPFLSVAEVNERDKKGISDFVWALRNVNFDVRQGEVLGIIGRNGSGKSTLLKILSQVSEPTTGSIKIKGRVASLLEVGTGFNPDLSGRENIFLNGAILGMTKAEIRSKFDAIVDFSGVERYIDTPVKRYSSGMKVRLGFSVAAHLDPEILIIDEVLAVGDAEFQAKCLGKMKNVAGSGRTVLFVSHNIYAVRTLCSRAIMLETGEKIMDGDTDDVANAYVALGKTSDTDKYVHQWETDGHFELGRMIRARIITKGDEIYKNSEIRCSFEIETKEETDNLGITFHLLNEEDLIVFGASSLEENTQVMKPGKRKLECIIPADLLNTGNYRIKAMVAKGGRLLFKQEDVLSFSVSEPVVEGATYFHRKKGVVRPKLKWEISDAG